MHKQVAYVAGPYRAGTERELVENIRDAEDIAIKLWQEGIPTICPHKNNAHFGGLCKDTDWLEGYLTILEACQLVMLVPGWKASKGTLVEIHHAKKKGIPVFERLVDVVAFVRYGVTL